ncbi:uncharacterized protein H6S33_002731 [Morchella sextelata]|uniref:uncharacterized protein n=1 Tax=Morchella sextelata TaxID=1174677 RepID=UPI001D05723E|nr:uncharacterized protein H6S33_002731 [Morchella sextelata]KAH0607697.1 hypothetical protein H6S33_002731 [Morchella sextelata]
MATPPLPPPPPPPPPPLALTTLHDQLLTLERQKASLTAQLLSLRATHPLSSASAPPAPPSSSSPASTTSTTTSSTTTTTSTQKTQEPLTDADHLAAVFASSTASAAASIARLHRIAGITTFTVRDPSPPHNTLLGVRIEVFCNRQFHPPHYLHISLAPPDHDPKAAPYTIHRHTLPPFIALPTPLPALPTLARTLRRQLTLHARRVAAATALRDAALSAGRVGDVTEGWENRVLDVEWDEGVSVVVVRWGCGVGGWVCVGEDGGVGRVVVVGRAGRRYREVERRVKGAGRLEGVAARLGWC